MIEKCYNKTHNKALRDSNLKGLLINNSLSGVIMTTANNTRNIERGQSRKPKLIYGCGFNSKGRYRAAKGGKNTLAYRTWNAMIQRCYCPKFHEKNTTYVDCVVIDHWLDYQNFAEWFYSHSYSEKGYQLDKDLLFPSNRVYSPETCCFVPQQLNSLLINCGSVRGALPQGVSFRNDTNKFRAQIARDGKNHAIGHFDTVNEAASAYKEAKERHVRNMALKWANRIEWDVFVALMNWRLVEGNQ